MSSTRHARQRFALCTLTLMASLAGVASAQRGPSPGRLVDPISTTLQGTGPGSEAGNQETHRTAVTFGGLPELSFTETSIDFGTVATGSRGPYVEAILVNESDSVPATDLSFSTSSPEFEVRTIFGPCGMGLDELPPGEECSVHVLFAPSAPGPAAGTLTATSAEGVEATMSLGGTGDGETVALHAQFHDWEVNDFFFAMHNTFYTTDAAWDSELADDFAITDPDGWTIEKVGLGVLHTNPFPAFPAELDIRFMPDDGGAPADVAVCSAPASEVVFLEDPPLEGRVEAALSAPCTLPPGHYWLAVTITTEHPHAVIWFGWNMRFDPDPPDVADPPVHLNPAVWRNPGGAYGFCPDWTPMYPPNCGFDDPPLLFTPYDAEFWLIGQGQPTEMVELTIDPAALDFGKVAVGNTSPPQSAELQNTGDIVLSGLAFSVEGGAFAADTSDCGATLDIDQSCQIEFTCTPVGPGPAFGVFDVTSDQGAQATLDLGCEGVSEGPVFTPTMLEVDLNPFATDANAVFEPGEVVQVAPAWHNGGAVPQSLSGTASEFQGPAGATYTLSVEEADYGLLDGGQTASCRDTGACYRLGVDPAAPRPATHWEATFREDLSDGTTKTWTLHIGDSFSDVPRESLFYRAIETLLHHDVTGGCSDTEYCPAGANTRGQMAVFLLKAVEEDPDYAPPACVEGEEMFPDVPFDSILCPWIEELAARGITSGCGGGNYCPTDSVTRAQMAIFLLKAALGPGYTPPPCAEEFGDVPCSSVFAAWIEDLAARGITSGCGDGNYCPGDPVTRAQMAVFVTNAFDLTLYGP